ncbi:MAG: protein translocase subunit SecF, partial [Gemmataceae bacterium]
MRPLIVIRHIPNIDFMGWRKFGFAFSLVLTMGSILLFGVRGLNFGIDFAGGTQINVQT